MKIETEAKGVRRDIYSKGLTFRKDEKYQKYLSEKHQKERVDNLEKKVDRILEVLEAMKND